MSLIQTIRNRGLLWLSVHSGLFLLDRFIEYVLYPVSIVGLGLVKGTGLMMLVSFLLCWGLTALYDWLSARAQNAPAASSWRIWMDALGFETLKGAMADAETDLLEPQAPRFWLSYSWGRSWYAWLLRPPVRPLEVFVDVLGLVLIRSVQFLVAVLGIVLYPLRVALYLVRLFVVKPLWLRFPKTRRVVLFFHLSVFFDPMTTIILMRPINHFRMGFKEWQIFLASVVISCSAWALLVWLGAESIFAVWPIIVEKWGVLWTQVSSLSFLFA